MNSLAGRERQKASWKELTWPRFKVGSNSNRDNIFTGSICVIKEGSVLRSLKFHRLINIFCRETKDKGKIGEVHLRTGYEGSDREWKCSFTLSLTLVLDKGMVKATLETL